ncbi:hypothetical protein [Effusibacillus dendaii]|uniref:Uncharacterized protein n=1 Tax=Effusibacillus dendaii TaxID=2743772 RepID=A0A7I8DDR2_9BACL|nr:hypothetical protein [Effusibacillus dendaii]BCJ86660.1 hypothetical protein skT53_16450 [Effusibacillus dendaii]
MQQSGKSGSIEYYIENLTVESIQNGILDLGVHMGDEMDTRIQTSGDQAGGGGEGRKSIKQRLQQVEQNMQEVRDSLQNLEQRWRDIEAQLQSFEQRVRYLEVLHL